MPPTNSNLVLLKLLKKNIKYISVDKGLQTNFDSNHWSKFNKVSTETKAKQSSAKTSGSNLNDKETPARAATFLNDKEKPSIQPFRSFSEQTNLKSSTKHQKSKSEVKFNKKDLKPDNSKHAFKTSKKNQQQDRVDQLDLCENWFECWQANSIKVVLNYEYYSCPVLNWNDRSIFIYKRKII